MKALLAVTAAALLAQSPVATRFEVATIKPSAAEQGSSGITTKHGRLTAENVTLKRCLMGAYGVGPHQIVGGPDWLDTARFVIVAKADQPTEDDDLFMLLLRDLLAERFKLAVHREKRPMQAYVLEVAKGGPKLEKSPGGEASTKTVGANGSTSIDARNTTMDSFGKILAREVDLPVANETGILGVFNLKLAWTPERARQDGATDGPSIYSALQEQLGLRLRAGKAPVDVIVIDHVETPSDN